MKDKGAALVVKKDDVQYVLPTQVININKVANDLGVKTDDIKIKVQINKPDEQLVKAVYDQAAKENYEVITPPVDFTLIAEIKDEDGQIKTQTISKFSKFVKRVFDVEKDKNAKHITTGVVINEDGILSHVPTMIYEKDGLTHADVNSLTNSSYTLIYNPIVIQAVEEHWSKDIVNDMASRLIIGNPETFKPDENVTRGDFAEYITKAIGIYRPGYATESRFKDIDINNDQLDAIEIAATYGIITGYPDHTFKANQTISREEAMVIFARAMKIIDLKANENSRIETFTDYSQVSDWAHEAVKETISVNIFNGRKEDEIAPQGTLTYAEAITAIRNMLVEGELINEK